MKTSLQKSKPKSAKAGNTKKFEAYREAFARIEAAQVQGFYVEVVAIQEAIVSDRLKSHLAHHQVLPSKRRPSLNDLINAWKKLNSSKDSGVNSEDLPERLNRWREQRNQTVHGLVSSDATLEQFLEESKAAAELGTELTKELCSWHAKEKRRARSKPVAERKK